MLIGVVKDELNFTKNENGEDTATFTLAVPRPHKDATFDDLRKGDKRKYHIDNIKCELNGELIQEFKSSYQRGASVEFWGYDKQLDDESTIFVVEKFNVYNNENED